MSTPDDGRVRCPRCGGDTQPQKPGGVCPACAFGEALSAPAAAGGASKLCLEDIPVPAGQSMAETAALPLPGPTIQISVPLTEKSGDKIGRYKLLEQIGEGGCGVVYVSPEPTERRYWLTQQ